MDELRVTDGVTTVELAASPNAVLEYIPQAPALDVKKSETGEYDEVVSVRYQNVTEKLKAAVSGDTFALALSERDKLERSGLRSF